MALDESVRDRISSVIASNRVVLFMKGSRHMPMCGFSGAVVQVLDSLVSDYATFNVLSDPSVREGIKEYSQWPTIPQLYVDGQLVGGCDIVREMHQTGELQQLLGQNAAGEGTSAKGAAGNDAASRVVPPKVTVTAAARAALAEAAEDAEAGATQLRVEIGARFEYALSFDEPRPGDVEVDAGGLMLRFDRASASRGDGMTIDYSEADGGGFSIQNPNEPSQVRQLEPARLKQMLAQGVKVSLFDVRTSEERAIAAIEGAQLFDAEADRAIMALPKDTTLVFHCHHGGRSQQAAERYVQQGFTQVYNLAGGIDAWSRDVDPAVPRY